MDIPKGTRIIEYMGEHITGAEADRRYPDDDRAERHHTFLFTLNQRTVIDAAHRGNEARFINHSCDPNCDAIIERGHIWIYAMQDIPKGAELAYDYQFEHVRDYTEEDLHFYGCRCGAANCRGTIVKVDRRRKFARRGTRRAARRRHAAAVTPATRTGRRDSGPVGRLRSPRCSSASWTTPASSRRPACPWTPRSTPTPITGEGAAAWMLGRFVVPASRLEAFDAAGRRDPARAGRRSWALSALVSADADAE